MAQVRAVSVIHPIHMRSWCVRFSLDIDLSILFILYLTHLLSHSFHFLTLKLVEYLCTPPKKGMASIDETYSLTGYEPNAYDFKETFVESYTELLTSPPFLSKQGFPEDAEYDDAALEDMLQVVRMHRLDFCWTDKKSEFLPSARQKLTDTNFKLIMTEEVYEN